MKILWNSVGPWLPTGYGQQTAQVCRRLRDADHDVAISAYAGLEGTVGEWEGMTVFPLDITRFNKLYLREYVKRHSEDGTGDDVQVITLQDVWVWTDGSARTGGRSADYEGLKMAAWCPVEYDPVPANTVHALQAFKARPIAMSRFGEQQLRKAGLDPLYVPHGVDTAVMRPLPGAARQVRAALDVPADAFLVGMVSNNQGITPPRKAFPEAFHAFSIFQQRHPEAILYLHTDIHGRNDGLNLIGLWRTHGISDSAVRWVNDEKFQVFYEIEPVHMAFMYSALDVLLCPSYGEGFGIPIVEAQSCGTPVIVTDWSAMSELAGPAQWLCDGEPHYHPGSASWFKKPAISELVDRLERAYAARGDRGLRDRCREFALGYDADRVFEEHWVPTIDALGKRRTVPPLPTLNREQRRARIKAKQREEA